MLGFKNNKVENKVENSTEDIIKKRNQYEYEKYHSFILLTDKLASIKNILLIGFSSSKQQDLLSVIYDKYYARLLNMFTKLTLEYQVRIQDKCNHSEFEDVSNEDICKDIIDFMMVEQIVSNYKKSGGC